MNNNSRSLIFILRMCMLLFVCSQGTDLLWAQTTQIKGSVVRLEKNGKKEWSVKVNGKPYFIKGVVYSYAKAGEDPNQGSLRDWMEVDDNKNGKNDGAYDSFVDKNRNDIKDADEPAVGDFQLLKEMGCNAIRLYHHPSASAALIPTYKSAAAQLLLDHEPNKQLLRDLYKRYGIMVMVGDFLGAHTNGSGADWQKGTDYTDPGQCKYMMESVRQMVLDFKDEPFLLFYCLGNENNLAFTQNNSREVPQVYAAFVNKAAKMIHELDPNHPVVLCQGGDGQMEVIAKYAPEIDIFGLNFYSLTGHFGNTWRLVKRKLDKPLLITEYGNYLVPKGGESFEKLQLDYHTIAWEEIRDNRAGGTGEGNSLGGFIFEWLDNWWQNQKPDIQNGDLEFFGVAGQGDGSCSPFLRHLRQVYYYYKRVWES